ALARSAATEAVQTMEPPPRPIMAGAACLIMSQGPIRLTRRISCHCSTVCSRSGMRPPLTPALAKTASTPPHSATHRPTAPATDASSPASAARARAEPPAAEASVTAASSAASSRSTASTRAPSRAKRRRLARPMPLAAPVMIARLPLSRPMGPGLDARVEHGFRHQARAVVALLGRLEAEGEANELLAAAVGEEGAPRGVLHPRGRGQVRQPALVGALGQPDPDEEAALRLADLRSAAVQHLVQPAQHGVALFPVHVDEQRHVRLEVVAQEIRGDARGKGIDAAPEEEALEGRDHLLRRAEPAQAKARPEDFRHGAGADHPAAGIERVQRGQVIALEAQLPV